MRANWQLQLWTSLTLFSTLTVALPQAPGTMLWAFKAGGDIESSPAVAEDGAIYFGCNDGRFYAVHANGTFKWRLDMYVRDPVIAADGTLIAVTRRRVYGLSPSGEYLWRYSTDEEFSFDYTAAAPDSGAVYAGADGLIDGDDTTKPKAAGRFYSIAPGGGRYWKLNFHNLFRSAPVVARDGTIFVGADNDRFFALTQQGFSKWTIRLSDYVVVSPALGSDGTVYVTDDDRILYAIAPDGAVRWNFPIGSRSYSSPAIAPDGTIYFGTDDSFLFALNPDGNVRWKFHAADVIRSSPAVAADGTIYFGAHDGRLYALNADGTLAWTFQTGGKIRSSPAIAPDGTVYIGSYDAFLYAIKGSAPLAASSWPKYRANLRQTGEASSVPIPTQQLRLGPMRKTVNGPTMTISSSRIEPLTIESSNDLQSWSMLETITPTNLTTDYVDRSSNRTLHRFYRVRTVRE